MKRTHAPVWITLLGAVLLLSTAARAAEPTKAGEHEKKPFAQVMMHDIMNGYWVEIPWPNASLKKEIDLHELFGHWDVTIAGHVVDLTPSRYVLILWFAAIALFLIFGVYGRRGYDEKGVPKGFNNGLEALLLFVRDEMAAATIGKKDAVYFTPFIATFFFLILFANMLGLVPYASVITNNLAVTGGLAAVAFVGIQFAGMRAQGVFAKPFALAVRLFANMTAGHVVILSLIGLIFVLHTAAMAVVSVPFALFIYLLEILVALIQAYVFAMLTALFIGLASHAH
jgi:F-type H+-transporting ATPase subunit a